MVDSIVLSAAQKGTLSSITRTQRTIDDITARLASGLKVASATDDPLNFFTAQGLRNTAGDFNRLLDGIGQSIRTVEQAVTGAQTTEELLNQAESLVEESKAKLEAGEEDLSVSEVEINSSPRPISEVILQSNPILYYSLDDTSNTAVNLGTAGASLDGTYVNGASSGAAALYDNGGTFSAQFDGTNDRINVPDSPLINTAPTNERTVELVFNADTTAGRQVLYEEGATVNGLTIYIDDGLVYVTAEDNNNYADININAAINAGETYHVAFVFDRFNNSFTGYLDGVEIGTAGVGNQIFPSHSGDIGIGRVNGGVQFHDGEDGGSGFAFQGRISDVAIYNDALSQSALETRANSLTATTFIRNINESYNKVLDQIDQVALDSQYRGINLLNNESLITKFNENGSSSLTTEGADLTVDGFGLIRYDFENINDLDTMLERIRDAKIKVRSFSQSLTNDLFVISTREDFTRQHVNTHLSGSDDLTLADANLEAANQLASQTRLNLGTIALNLATQSQQAVLRLF